MLISKNNIFQKQLCLMAFLLSASISSGAFAVRLDEASFAYLDKLSANILTVCENGNSAMCLEARHDAVVTIQALGSDWVKKLLLHVGGQRGGSAKRSLWPIVYDLHGHAAMVALREFYLEWPSSPPANFFNHIQRKYQDLASLDDVSIVIDAYLKGGKNKSGNAYSLAANLVDAKFLELYESKYAASEDVEKKRTLLLLVTRVGGPESYNTAVDMVANEKEGQDDKGIDFFIRALNFIGADGGLRPYLESDARSEMRIRRLAAYSRLADMDEKWARVLAAKSLQKERARKDKLAINLLEKIVGTARD